jgi:hypothetical protein
MTKQQDDKEFKARWMAYGMSLKTRGDALGIEWRGKSFEKYEAEVSFYEEWARPKGEVEHA